MALQAGVFDPADPGVLFQEFGHGLGVLDVPVHAQAERLDALDGQEAVERALAGAVVAQDLHACLDDEGGQPDRRQIGIHQPVIGLDRAG